VTPHFASRPHLGTRRPDEQVSTTLGLRSIQALSVSDRRDPPAALLIMSNDTTAQAPSNGEIHRTPIL
jgi:hypothetical protein